jgi:hypothetical protein
VDLEPEDSDEANKEEEEEEKEEEEEEEVEEEEEEDLDDFELTNEIPSSSVAHKIRHGHGDRNSLNTEIKSFRNVPPQSLKC